MAGEPDRLVQAIQQSDHVAIVGFPAPECRKVRRTGAGPVPPHVPGQDIDVRGKLIKEGAVQAAMETRCMGPVHRGARFGLRPTPQCDLRAIRRLELVAFRVVVLIVHEDLLLWPPLSGATTEPDRWRSVCAYRPASRSPGPGCSACLAGQFRRWRTSIGPARSGGS